MALELEDQEQAASLLLAFVTAYGNFVACIIYVLFSRKQDKIYWKKLSMSANNTIHTNISINGSHHTAADSTIEPIKAAMTSGNMKTGSMYYY